MYNIFVFVKKSIGDICRSLNMSKKLLTTKSDGSILRSPIFSHIYYAILHPVNILKIQPAPFGARLKIHLATFVAQLNKIYSSISILLVPLYMCFRSKTQQVKLLHLLKNQPATFVAR